MQYRVRKYTYISSGAIKGELILKPFCSIEPSDIILFLMKNIE